MHAHLILSNRLLHRAAKQQEGGLPRAPSLAIFRRGRRAGRPVRRPNRCTGRRSGEWLSELLDAVAGSASSDPKEGESVFEIDL